MNFTEAKQLLKKNGYVLTEMQAPKCVYVCIYLYGDSAHENPENMEIQRVTLHKQEAVEEVVNFFDYGPDDISWMVVVKGDLNKIDEYRRLIGVDLAEDDDIREELLGLNYVEFNGTDFAEEWDNCEAELEDEDDDFERENARTNCGDYIRKEIGKQIDTLG